MNSGRICGCNKAPSDDNRPYSFCLFFADRRKKEQESRPLRKIDDSFKKIIVTKDIVPANYDENGVLTINIYDFLLDEAILEK